MLVSIIAQCWVRWIPSSWTQTWNSWIFLWGVIHMLALQGIDASLFVILETCVDLLNSWNDNMQHVVKAWVNLELLWLWLHISVYAELFNLSLGSFASSLKQVLVIPTQPYSVLAKYQFLLSTISCQCMKRHNINT